jgi:AraC family transcriptional regulator
MIDVQLKTTEPETVAFIAMNGPYEQMPEAMGRLYGWVGEHGLQPTGMPEGVFLTDPSSLAAEIVWELRAPVAGEIAETPTDPSRCGIKRVEPHLVAFAMHRGPYESVGDTYNELMTWIGANGLRVDGPPEELYYSDPKTTAPEDYLTEVRLPVAKV